MSRIFLLFTLIFITFSAFSLTTTWALPYTVTLNVSSIAGSEFELDFQLFDNDFITGNTSVLIDNVFITDAGGLITPPGVINFESGGFEGFAPLTSDDPVSIVSGGFTGGSFLLRLDESPIVNPTITFRNFLPSTATTLQFDFELATASADDSVVASILDPNNGWAAFSNIPDLYGFGDFLEATSSGNTLASGANANVIPEPSTILLIGFGLFGLLSISIKRKRRKQS